MKNLFSLFLAVVCCSMVFGQIISVTDGTLSDWDNVPSEYLFKTECAPNAMWDGLKSVQVYVDMTYINLLVEVNDEVVTDREWTPFHVFINSDNSSSTGGYGGSGDLWMDADTDLMLETAIYQSGAVAYNPGVFKWWGEVGGSGWQWTDPNGVADETNGWGALVPEGSMPIGNAQMVDDKIEIQLDYTQIPMPFDETTFTLGFDIQQSWNSVGVLPNANEDETGYNVLAEKLRVYVHQQNKTKTTIGGIQYRLTSDVEPYTAEVFFLKEASVTEIAIPETIAVDGITYTVTSIGEYAFSECSSLTSIVIPNGVTSIGERTFEGCSGLRFVTIGNGVKSIGNSAFSECTALASVTIPESVTSIGERAFEGCSSLTSVTIPNSVKSIGDRVFYNCSSLTSINVKSNNPNYSSIDGVLFDKNQTALVLYPIGKQGAYTIPNSVKSIGDDAFYGCRSLTSVTIPNGVTSIGSSAFYYCFSLTSVTIPNGVTSIGDWAFGYCSSLTAITIPEGITSIESGTFSECTALASVTIPESVTSIGDYAFRDCSSLTSIVIPNGVTSIGGSAFFYCSSLTSVTIPEGVTSIEYGVFSGCTSLSSVTIPKSVTSIGSSAFYNCSSLTSVTIPEGVASIEQAVFVGCTSLSSITIPESVVWIGFWAFENCSSLKTVICEAIEVPGLGGNDVFSYMPLSEAILYVPAQSLDDYKAADQWKEFGTILPLTDAPTDIENISYESQDSFPSSTSTCQKLFRNGQFVILRDGKTYTAMGAEIQ